MLAAVVKETVTFVDLSAYPRWLLVLAATLVVAFGIWVLMKLLKWTLWFLFFAVVIGGSAWAFWLLLQ